MSGIPSRSESPSVLMVKLAKVDPARFVMKRRIGELVTSVVGAVNVKKLVRSLTIFVNSEVAPLLHCHVNGSGFPVAAALTVTTAPVTAVTLIGATVRAGRMSGAR